MPLEAGSVYVRLGGKVEPAGFRKFDEELKKREKKVVHATLGAKVEDEGFNRFEARLKKIDSKTAEAKLKVRVDEASVRKAEARMKTFTRDEKVTAQVKVDLDMASKRRAKARLERNFKNPLKQKITTVLDERALLRTESRIKKLVKKRDLPILPSLLRGAGHGAAAGVGAGGAEEILARFGGRAGFGPESGGFGAAAQSVDQLTEAGARLASTFGKVGSIFSALDLVGMAGAIGSLVQAIGQLVVGAGALVGALVPLVGLLASLPQLIATAAGGFAVFTVGITKIVQGMQALKLQQEEGADIAAQFADAQAAAADNVKAAEEGVTQAQKNSKIAQENLTFARRDAERQLNDMKLAVESAALAEKNAAFGLKDARAALREAMAGGDQDAISRARLGLDAAELAQRQARIAAGRQRADTRRALKDGVEGSPQVKQALEDVKQAQRGVTDASKALTQAQKEQARVAKEIAAAQKEQAAALNALTGPARKLAEYLLTLSDRWKELTKAAQGFAPGLEKGLRAAMRNFDVFRDGTAKIARAIGANFEEFGKFLGSAGMRRDIGLLTDESAKMVRRFGELFTSISSGIRHVMVAARPFNDFLSKAFVDAAKHFDAWAKRGRQTGSIRRFLEVTERVLKRTVSIFGNLSEAIVNFGLIAERSLGGHLLAGLERLTERWADFTGSFRGKNEIAHYLNSVQGPLDQLLGLIGDLAKGFLAISGGEAGRSFGDFVRSIRDLMEPLGKLITTLLSGVQRLGTRILDAIGRDTLDALNSLAEAFFSIANAIGDITLGPLSGLAKLLKGIADALNFMIDKVPGFKQLVAAITVIIAARAGFGAIVNMMDKFAAGTGAAAASQASLAANAAAAARALEAEAVAMKHAQGAGAMGAMPGAGYPAAGGPLIYGKSGERPPRTGGVPGFFGTRGQGFGQRARTGFSNVGKVFGRGQEGVVAREGLKQSFGLGRVAEVGIGGVARGLGKIALPIAGLFALTDFLTTAGGIGNKLKGAAKGATFGLSELIPGLKVQPSRQERRSKATEGASQFIQDMGPAQNLKGAYERIVKLRSEIARLATKDKDINKDALKILRDELRAVRDRVGAQQELLNVQSRQAAPGKFRELRETFERATQRIGPAKAFEQFTRQSLGALKHMQGEGKKRFAGMALEWAQEQTKQNPKLAKAFSGFQNTVLKDLGQFRNRATRLGKQVFTGTEKEWDAIYKKLRGKYQREVAAGKEGLTDLQRKGVRVLEAFGIPRKKAQEFVLAMEVGGKRRIKAEERIREVIEQQNRRLRIQKRLKEEIEAGSKVQKPDKGDKGGGGSTLNLNPTGKGPELKIQLPPLKWGFKGQHGGFVKGQGKETDSVVALLTPGEFVLKPKTVDKIGLSTLTRINRTGELPAQGRRTLKFAEGGPVGTKGLKQGDDKAIDELRRLERAVDRITKRIRTAVKENLEGVGNTIKTAFKGATPDVKRVVEGIAKQFDGISAAARREGEQAGEQLAVGIKRAMNPVRDAMQSLSSLVVRQFGAMQEDSEAQVKQLVRQMNTLFGDLPKAVGDPLGDMLKQVADALEVLGEKKDARKIKAVAQKARRGSGGGGGDRADAARGGFVEGLGHHDTVDMDLDESAAVINRHQAKPIEKALRKVGKSVRGLFGKRSAKATGGRLRPVRVAPKEIIAYPEQQAEIDDALRTAHSQGESPYRSLDQVFSSIRTPHFMAEGGRPKQQKKQPVSRRKAKTKKEKAKEDRKEKQPTAKRRDEAARGLPARKSSKASGILSLSDLERLARSVGFKNGEFWKQVAYAESGGNPDAENRSGATGLFQIMWPLHKSVVQRVTGKRDVSRQDLHDPVVNAKVAFQLSKRGKDVTPWEPSRNAGSGGGWGKYLPDSGPGGAGKRGAAFTGAGDELPDLRVRVRGPEGSRKSLVTAALKKVARAGKRTMGKATPEIKGVKGGTARDISGIQKQWQVHRAIASIGAAALAEFPWLGIISGFRANSTVAGTGSRSHHADKDALDLGTVYGARNLRVAAWVREHFSERVRGVSEPVLDHVNDPNPPDHADHVHVAAKGDKALAVRQRKARGGFVAPAAKPKTEKDAKAKKKVQKKKTARKRPQPKTDRKRTTRARGGYIGGKVKQPLRTLRDFARVGLIGRRFALGGWVDESAEEPVAFLAEGARSSEGERLPYKQEAAGSRPAAPIFARGGQVEEEEPDDKPIILHERKPRKKSTRKKMARKEVTPRKKFDRGGFVDRAKQFLEGDGLTSRMLRQVPGGAVIAGLVTEVSSLQGELGSVESAIESAPVVHLAKGKPPKKKKQQFVTEKLETVGKHTLDPNKKYATSGGKPITPKTHKELFKTGRPVATPEGHRTKRKGKDLKGPKIILFPKIPGLDENTLLGSTTMQARDQALGNIMDYLDEKLFGRDLPRLEEDYSDTVDRYSSDPRPWLITEDVTTGRAVAPHIDEAALAKRVEELTILINKKTAIIARMRQIVGVLQATLVWVIGAIERRKKALDRIEKRVEHNMDRVRAAEADLKSISSAEGLIDKKGKLSTKNRSAVKAHWRNVFGNTKGFDALSEKEISSRFSGQGKELRNRREQLMTENLKLGGGNRKVDAENEKGYYGAIKASLDDELKSDQSSLMADLTDMRGFGGAWIGGDTYDPLKKTGKMPPDNAVKTYTTRYGRLGQELKDLYLRVTVPDINQETGLEQQLEWLDRSKGKSLVDNELKKASDAFKDPELERGLAFAREENINLRRQLALTTAVNPLAAKFLGQFEEGGFLPETGYYKGHRGERVLSVDEQKKGKGTGDIVVKPNITIINQGDPDDFSRRVVAIVDGKSVEIQKAQSAALGRQLTNGKAAAGTPGGF